MHTANERRRYIVTSSLTGKAYIQNDPRCCHWCLYCICIVFHGLLSELNVNVDIYIALLNHFIMKTFTEDKGSGSPMAYIHPDALQGLYRLGNLRDDVIKWKHKGQWREALIFSSICARINNWVSNGEAGDLRRYRAHYDVTVISISPNVSYSS